ncbi:MurR/RpiR family transcriptional regulator [Thermoflavimicrobium dichotomicum]|uniref:DNA-binding transcriptional regulator, MurR/RpiR family, contains HTH and SIS domains n=1 Tax=Thermoflavimicrobium dichotomicum TaxID=46223 RepID=A0A1I3P5E7_9BACL|nr:MurR/RpiR family transcriptional regulator [Thermoflavimicrobium dichotomicum]SFJ16266.1 DNA-binding transcriptional regulator, MurR/RpiR family, contains HTH and SIS domains [Thermoflavimicrobium dichotomicum]
MKNSFFERIKEKKGQMSKSQLKIVHFIEQHIDEVPFLTVAQLAKRAGVGEATVVRFANYLGFQGYADMQEALQSYLRERLNTVERLKIADDTYAVQNQLAFDILSDDIRNIQRTMQTLDRRVFHEAVELITNARSVTIVAFRSSHALGYFLAFYLRLLLKEVHLLSHSDTMFEHLARLGEEDLVLGITFSRYTARTIQALKFAHEKGVKTLAITDQLTSPAVNYSSLHLLAASHLPSFHDSFVAPLSLINALLTAIAKKNYHAISEHLTKMEEIWEKEAVYDAFKI